MASSDKGLAETAFADPRPDRRDDEPATKASSKKDKSPLLPPSPYEITLSLRTSDAGLDAARKDPSHLPSHHVPTLVASAAHTGGAVIKAASKLTGARLPGPNEAPKNKREKIITKGKQKLLAAGQKKSVNGTLVPLLTFENPWPSFRGPSAKDAIKGGLKWGLPKGYVHGAGKGRYKGGGKRVKGAGVERDEKLEAVEVRKPDWGLAGRGTEQQKEWECRGSGGKDVKAVRVTWLGHATTLVQFPSLVGEVDVDHPATATEQPNGDAAPQAEVPEEDDEEDPSNSPGAASTPSKKKRTKRPIPPHVPDTLRSVSQRSFNVLFDPIFSERCSPSQNAGPFRFTPAPCEADDLPPIDAVLISHNHYDHLDLLSLRRLRKLRRSDLHIFVPLGNKGWFVAEGFKEEKVTELDWWDEASLVPKGSREGESVAQKGRLRVIATPAQHGSGRGAGDKNTALWASWYLEWTAPSAKDKNEAQKDNKEGNKFSVFFAGDTGLRSHNESRKPRTEYPVCPAFKEISQRFSAPNLLLLPISVGSSLSYLRQWDPFPRRFSPFPRVESPLTSAIHADGLDAVHMLKIMAGTKDAEALEGPKLEDAKEEEERQREKWKAKPGEGEMMRRFQRPKKMTAVAVHFGTFVRNDEQTRSDVYALRRACADNGVRFVRAGPMGEGEDGGVAQEGDEGGKEEGAMAEGAKKEGAKAEEVPEGEANEANEVKEAKEDQDPELDFVVAHQGQTVWIPIP